MVVKENAQFNISGICPRRYLQPQKPGNRKIDQTPPAKMPQNATAETTKRVPKSYAAKAMQTWLVNRFVNSEKADDGAVVNILSTKCRQCTQRPRRLSTRMGAA